MGGALRRGGGLVAAFAVLALPASTGARNALFPPPLTLTLGYQGVEKGLPAEYPQPVKTGRPCTIGFQNPDAQSEKFWFVQLAVARKAALLGCKMIGLDDALSSDKQVANMKLLLARKVGAIIFYPLSATATTPVLQQAQAAKVHVVGIDASFGLTRKVPLIDTQVWDGLDIQAYLQARQLRGLRSGAKLGLIDLAGGVPAVGYLHVREAFWAKTIAHATLVGSKANPTGSVAGGEQATDALLAQHPNIEAVIAYNDDSAIGAAEASAGRSLVLIGNDGSTAATSALVSGSLAATVRADAVGIGVQSAVAAYSLIMQQHLPLPNVVLRSGQAMAIASCVMCLHGGPVSWYVQVPMIQ